MEPAKITMKPSIIIKLWIKRQDKDSICVDERTMAKVDEYKSSFPVLENLVKKERIIPKEFYPFRLALYSKDDLDTQKFVEKPNFDFFQKKLIGRQSHNISTNDPEAEFSPIIHIFQDESEREIFFGNEYLTKHQNAPRLRAIVDSSIWNYFLCHPNNLKAIIKKIYDNYKLDYYNLLIAKEYADLNARIATMAYLYENPLEEKNNKQEGHGKAVSPFLFHSEQDLAAKREAEYKNKLEGTVYDFKKYKWRVLLVDDKIDNNYLTPSKLGVSKEKIVKERINYLFGEECKCDYISLSEKKDSTNESDKYDFESAFNSISSSEDDKGHVVLLCVDSIEKAKAALKNYKFDFILLDYLLEKHKDKDGKEIERHYGYELLTDLADEANGIGKDCEDLTPYLHYDKGKRYIVGPDHRYFFMFISAFTTAISERLRLFGFSRSEKLWHIAEGACPTNTPELFCYNLQKMMVKRIKDSGLEKLNPDKILKLTEKIFRKATDGKESVRKRANENYTEILSLLYHYNRVRQDIERPSDDRPTLWSTRGSVLMTAYFNDYLAMGGLLEHLAHLVHLTAFGTARQWSEMWEEYLYFKNQFTDLFYGKLDKTFTRMIDDQGQKNTINDALNMLYNSIGDYILELKKIN